MVCFNRDSGAWIHQNTYPKVIEPHIRNQRCAGSEIIEIVAPEPERERARSLSESAQKRAKARARAESVLLEIAAPEVTKMRARKS